MSQLAADLVLGHHAFGIVLVVLTPIGHVAVAVAPEIGGHHGVLLGQGRRDLAPTGDVDRRSMQEQERRPAATDHAIDVDAGRCFEPDWLEAWEKFE